MQGLPFGRGRPRQLRGRVGSARGDGQSAASAVASLGRSLAVTAAGAAAAGATGSLETAAAANGGGFPLASDFGGSSHSESDFSGGGGSRGGDGRGKHHASCSSEDVGTYFPWRLSKAGGSKPPAAAPLSPLRLMALRASVDRAQECLWTNAKRLSISPAITAAGATVALEEVSALFPRGNADAEKLHAVVQGLIARVKPVRITRNSRCDECDERALGLYGIAYSLLDGLVPVSSGVLVGPRLDEYLSLVDQLFTEIDSMCPAVTRAAGLRPRWGSDKKHH